MELYIQIINGQPFEHPILGDNFRQAFPDIDTNNLPESFAKFERIDVTIPAVYEIYEGITYEWIGDIVSDVHHIRPMTAEEKLAKIEAAKAYPHPDEYVFDEDLCCWNTPVAEESP